MFIDFHTISIIFFIGSFPLPLLCPPLFGPVMKLAEFSCNESDCLLCANLLQKVNSERRQNIKLYKTYLDVVVSGQYVQMISILFQLSKMISNYDCASGEHHETRAVTFFLVSWSSPFEPFFNTTFIKIHEHLAMGVWTTSFCVWSGVFCQSLGAKTTPCDEAGSFHLSRDRKENTGAFHRIEFIILIITIFEFSLPQHEDSQPGKGTKSVHR